MKLLGWFFIFAFCLSSPLEAHEIPRFNQYIQRVNDQYPLVLAAQQDLLAAEGERLSSLGAFDWTLKGKARNTFEGYYRNQTFESQLEKPTEILGMSAFGGYRYGAGTFASYDSGETLSQGEIFFGLELPLLRNRSVDRRRAQLEKSEIGVRAAQQSFRMQKIDIFRWATHRYWDYLASIQRRDVIRDLLKNATDRNQQLNERVKHGDVAQIELLENERAILNRKAQEVQAERNLNAAILQLSLFFRDENGAPLRVASDSRPEGVLLDFMKVQKAPDLGLDVQKALTQRPDYLKLHNQIEQNEVDLKYSRNQFQPKLDLHFQYYRGFGQGSTSLVPAEAQALLMLEIPIQRRGQEGRLSQGIAQQARLDAQAQLARERIQVEVQESLLSLRAAEEKVRYAQAEYDLAHRLQKGEYERFKNGDSQLILVNLREQQTADAAMKRIDALLEHHISVALYHAAVGNLGYWEE